MNQIEKLYDQGKYYQVYKIALELKEENEKLKEKLVEAYRRVQLIRTIYVENTIPAPNPLYLKETKDE